MCSVLVIRSINVSSIFGASGGFGTSPAYHAAKWCGPQHPEVAPPAPSEEGGTEEGVVGAERVAICHSGHVVDGAGEWVGVGDGVGVGDLAGVV